jgi:diketogulonate reductase-like aldo/keto reductase
VGYRYVDTAQAYGNERGVGEGVWTTGVSRGQVFVSTKLAAEIKDYDGAVAAVDGSLATMGLDYIDLMLINSPQPWNDFRGGDYAEGNRQAWRALEDASKAGKLRAIGVSNFQQEDIENILQVSTVAPQVNQLLVHVGNTPAELLAYCESRDILVEAYSPIGHGAILENQEIQEIAKRNEVTVAQLSLRYAIQLGTVPLPKTANLEHMRSNAELDFSISDEDMVVLRNMQVRDYGEYGAFPVFSGK